jgi:hypothetical protein
MIIEEYKGIATDGKRRSLVKITCDVCGALVIRQKRYLKDVGGLHFCTPTCKAFLSKTRILTNCGLCGKEFSLRKSTLEKGTKSGLNFCSRECADLAKGELEGARVVHFNTGRHNYRAKALSRLENSCSVCGLEDTRCLVVHHIDKDRDNNKLDNLQILCANCHMITHRS